MLAESIYTEIVDFSISSDVLQFSSNLPNWDLNAANKTHFVCSTAIATLKYVFTNSNSHVECIKSQQNLFSINKKKRETYRKIIFYETHENEIYFLSIKI